MLQNGAARILLDTNAKDRVSMMEESKGNQENSTHEEGRR
jgi:hypothetical protein